MQLWTQPALPAKSHHLTALSRSVTKLLPRLVQACQNWLLWLFPWYCAVTEAVPRSWCVVTHLESAIYQSVTLVVINRAGIIGQQSWLSRSRYRNTDIHKYAIETTVPCKIYNTYNYNLESI